MKRTEIFGFVSVLVFLQSCFQLFCSVDCARYSNVRPCPIGTGEKSDCASRVFESALRTAAKGSKKLGVSPIDPLEVTEWTFIFNDSELINGIATLTNTTLNGLSKTKISSFQRLSNDGLAYRFISETPNLVLESPYNMTLRLLFLPAVGQSEMKINFVNLRMMHEIRGDMYERNGKPYFRITNYAIPFMRVDNVVGNLGRLFNSRRANDLVELIGFENGVLIFEGGKWTLGDGLSIIFTRHMNNFLKRIPFDRMLILS